ncbi:hypothetical protein AGLY_005753 [Aphis glycines]|uniref:Uncharacterized protein n=1 Tax=Aphis glycines TaxID=307491 RepID=A0A6G0TU70_APHGL|nr:hypothetical protein AGLY_005753 [Aphis glycines]
MTIKTNCKMHTATIVENLVLPRKSPMPVPIESLKDLGHDIKSEYTDNSYVVALGYEMINYKHSERSNKCIDFTMMCVCFFFASVQHSLVEIMLQFRTLGMVSDGKVNILGALYRSKVNIFQQFSKKSKKTKKSDGKTVIFTQNQFSIKSSFLYGCNSKTNHCKYLKFSPNVYDLKYNTKFSISFSSSISRENSKHHYRKNFKYLKILPTTEIFNFSKKFFFEVSIKFLWPNKNI